MRYAGEITDYQNALGAPSKFMSQDRQYMFKELAVAASADTQADFYSRDKRYPYIPLTIPCFISAVLPHLKDNMRVIDVGCGAGDKLLAFHTLNSTLRITGIEYTATMAACAKYICGSFANVIHGDAFEHTYSEYDLVYMYRPICDPDMQGDLQLHVMESMKIGATLIIVYPEWQNPRTGNRFEMLDKFDRGWVKE